MEEHPLDKPFIHCDRPTLVRHLVSLAVPSNVNVFVFVKKQAASLGGFAVLWNGLVVGMTASILTGEARM